MSNPVKEEKTTDAKQSTPTTPYATRMTISKEQYENNEFIPIGLGGFEAKEATILEEYDDHFGEARYAIEWRGDIFGHGNRYTLLEKNITNLEIRHFVLRLFDDIDEQMCFIEENDINGLSFIGQYPKANEEWQNEFDLTWDALSKIGHRLIFLNLKYFENLTTLNILDLTPNLKRLSLFCKVKKAYDFTKLPQLKEVSLWYSKHLASLFECTGIKKLEIFKMDDDAAENIKNLYQLEDLCIRQTNVKSIEGLRALKDLKKLDIMHSPKMETISQVQECQNLEWFSISSGKRITDWDVISKLPKLKKLFMENCGTLEDINFLKPLENLEEVRIIGTNRKLIDRNVRWLYERPKMKRISLPWRKDFDITIEEYWERQ